METRYREQHCYCVDIPHKFKTLTSTRNQLNGGTSIFQQCYSKDYCCHVRYPSFPDDFPHFGEYLIGVVCSECATSILIKSNYAQMFQTILMDIWFSAQDKAEVTGQMNIDVNYYQYLLCFIKIFSHPQIQHFMQRKRKLFTRLIQIVFFGYETLQIIQKWNSDPFLTQILSEYYGFIRYVLIFCRKNYHLECIMNLKYIIGGSLWQKYIIDPYKSNTEAPQYAFSITMIGYMVKYRDYLLKNKSKSIIKNKQRHRKIQRCLMEVKNAVELHIKLNESKSMFESYFNPIPKAVEEDFKIKLWAFFYALKCNNVKCKRNYCLHKHGIDNFDGEWMKNIDDKLKPKSKWYICKGCHLVYYCSRKCQKIDWSRNKHKLLCQSIKL